MRLILVNPDGLSEKAYKQILKNWCRTPILRFFSLPKIVSLLSITLQLEAEFSGEIAMIMPDKMYNIGALTAYESLPWR
jgi:hypothetical protein